jgi:hypothetical protein
MDSPRLIHNKVCCARRTRLGRVAPSAANASNGLASAASDATMGATSIHLWDRALRRQQMVRDLEVFLAVESGGWPLKSNRAVHQRSSAEAGRAFAST